MMRIDWIDKLRHFLQTMAFSLTVSAVQYAFRPERPYEVAMVYSLAIGFFIWASIDFGRHLFPSTLETGWPQGSAGVILPIAGITLGYTLGTLTSDSWFGWSSWGSQGLAELRLSLLITLVAGSSITYYFYIRNKAAYLQARMNEARQHANEARLKLLETQLEPHMLFNTLANLRVLIGIDPQRAQDMLDRMVAYLRATLDASRASSHPLEREFDRLRDYLELMAVRMGPRMRYTLDLPADLAGVPIPTLLLQPLVENSIKHGLEPKLEGGAITVGARLDGGLLRLEVSDTGVGFDTTTARSDGFGLAQVQERLATAYGERAGLQRQSIPGQGTSVHLSLPLAP
jgi:signal transduction histidine kinase